ncbi:MAG: carboxypeptidase regulatory-like domain-containing protein [Deltaproteobacteria bacterium]|nr:carboxypeptidase regulatory-like domain-containing protein [Deltaproteobacteria bacterium]
MKRTHAILSILSCICATAASAQNLSGIVVDASGAPLPGVRVRAARVASGQSPVVSNDYITTGEDGAFSIPSPSRPGEYVYISFGKNRYEIVSGMVDGSAGVNLGRIRLTPVTPIDNPNHDWVPPYFPVDDTSRMGCNFCHGEQYRAWKDSLMAISASPENTWVRSLYESTQGPSYRTENPDKAGPCANCHAPAAAIDAPSETVLSEVSGVAENGVFCAVCHSIREIRDVQKPGVDGSLVLIRPSAWTALFAYGPYDDAASQPMTTSYNPLIKEARLCAGCHEWTNDLGVQVLSTFTEWSEMAGADPDALVCQDCHMRKRIGSYTPPDPTLGYILDNEHMAGMYANLRRRDTMSPHVFRGGRELAEEAAELSVGMRQEDRELVITTTVSNTNAGHALPTGMPFRHVLMQVEVKLGGQFLTQTGGPTIPDYGGEGTSERDLAGKPGKGYAKVVGDGLGARNVPFWRASEVLEDTRIRAGESEVLEFRFALPKSGGPVEARVSLIYRRAFLELVRQKGWMMDDLVIGNERIEATVPPAPVDDEPEPVPEPEPTVTLDTSNSGCSCDTGRQSAAPALLLAFGGLLLGRTRGRRARRRR